MHAYIHMYMIPYMEKKQCLEIFRHRWIPRYLNRQGRSHLAGCRTCSSRACWGRGFLRTRPVRADDPRRWCACATRSGCSIRSWRTHCRSRTWFPPRRPCTRWSTSAINKPPSQHEEDQTLRSWKFRAVPVSLEFLSQCSRSTFLPQTPNPKPLKSMIIIFELFFL